MANDILSQWHEHEHVDDALSDLDADGVLSSQLKSSIVTKNIVNAHLPFAMS